jgi:hypothetical protein
MRSPHESRTRGFGPLTKARLLRLLLAELDDGIDVTDGVAKSLGPKYESLARKYSAA